MSPKKKINGLVFFPIPEFDTASLAFGADEKCFFKRNSRPEVPSKYEDLASRLFFKGGELPVFAPKVDEVLAKKAITAWLTSWAPPHESKITTVGYALWLWCEGEL